jgi:hypothetical protein
MTRKSEWGNLGDLVQLTELEAYLRASLQPIPVRPDFKASLYERLALALPHANPEQKEGKNPVQTILLTAAGIVSSLMIVAASIRAVVTLLGAIRAVRQVKEEMAQKQAAPASTVL